MPVTQTLMAVGSWSISLSPQTPRAIVDALSTGYFGHLVVATGRQDPRVAGNSLFSAGRFTGVMTGANFQTLAPGRGPVISGDGLATWLGTPSGVGPVIENATLYTSAAIPTVVNGLRPSSVGAGTIYSIAGSGTYTGTFVWKTPRDALTSFAQQVSTGSLDSQTVEWRINNNNTLDFGPVSSLYVTSPSTAVVARDSGVDMRVRALPGQGQLTEDVKDYTSRVVVLAQGSGTSTAVGSANAADVGAATPYYDFFGNPVKMTRMVSASSVSSFNATAAAQSALIPYTLPRDQVKLSTSEYDIDGQLRVGDYVWVYDADAGLTSSANEVIFRGQRINPVRLRVIEATWPVVEGMTVAFRTPTTPTNPNGTWYDLTDYVVWETGDTTLVVGGFNRNLVPTSEPVGPRPQPDTTIPGVPVFNTPFATSTYQSPSDGKTKSQILVSWATPTNTDGTTMTDGSHYEVQYRPDIGLFSTNPSYNQLNAAGFTYNTLAGVGGTYNSLIPQVQSQWKITFVAFGTNQLLIQELTPGITYDFQIRAVDTAQPPNLGAWSATTTFQAAADSIAPPTPDAPTVAAGLASVQITWDCGRADGGTFNQASDLHHIEVYGSIDPLFTPSPSFKLGNLPASVANITGGIAVVGTFTLPVGSPPGQSLFIKIIAVDYTGNKSLPSPAAGATAQLWSDAYISDLSVSKLTAGTITASVILGSTIATAPAGSRVVMDGVNDAFEVYDPNGSIVTKIDPTGFNMYDASGNSIANWYHNGLTMFNIGLSGKIFINAATGGISPIINLDSGSGASGGTAIPLASIYTLNNTTSDIMVVNGPVTAIDPGLSSVNIDLVGANGSSLDDGHMSIQFNSVTAGRAYTPMRWDKKGVGVAQILNGSSAPSANPTIISGSVVQNDDVGFGLGARFVHMADYSGTTDANGNLAFNHGCNFTPAGCVALMHFTSGSPGTATQIIVNFNSFTSSQASFQFYVPTGTKLLNTFVSFYAIFWV